MKICVAKETLDGETRVAITPKSVKALIKNGFEVVVEKGAGVGSFYKDSDYEAAGATTADTKTVYSSGDLLVKIQKPTDSEIDMMKEGIAFIALYFPLVNTDTTKKLASKKVNSFALDSIPRTTLAQAMDVLSSMSTVAGYKAVLLAATELPKFFPMLMTAAGTVAPAKVLVLGAGVAGLQACAVAKKLGGVVEAFDQRPAVKDQVKSLGAKFIEVPTEESAETEGGYAKELSDDYKKKQAELIAKHVKKSDVVITTALIPGKPAPVLIPEDMVKDMKEGAVIVDLAAEFGGNCPLTESGKIVVKHGVKLIGTTNLPATMPADASDMFSKNVENFINHLTKKGEDDKVALEYNLEDEITKGSLITHNGTIVDERQK